MADVVTLSYMTISIPFNTPQETAAVVLLTRPKSEPPFGAIEAETYASLFRHHLTVVVHVLLRNQAVFHALDRLINDVRPLGLPIGARSVACALTAAAGAVEHARCAPDRL